LAVVEGETSGDVQFETDRARFLGRGQTIRSPAAIADGWPLSNTAGAVLDPIFSLRRHVRILPGATARIAFWTLAASSRDDVLDLADKHQDAMAFERAMTLAWTQAQMQLHHLGISVNEAHLFQRLANHVLYSDPTLRPGADVIAHGLRKSSTLWGQGISGNLPLVLVRIEEDDDLELVRQLLRAHEYWRLKQLAVDLVILNERSTSYVQDLQNEIGVIVRMNQSLPKIAKELGVDAIVEGSVSRSSSQVRITAQLIDASKDKHLWADSFQRDVKDVLALQGEVAQAIAEKIRIRLTPEEKTGLAASRPVDPEAYESYLQGRYYWYRRTPADAVRSRDFFQKAVDKDPNYAAGWAGLAAAYDLLGSSQYSMMAPREGRPKELEACQKAISLDPGNAEAHALRESQGAGVLELSGRRHAQIDVVEARRDTAYA